MEKPTPRSLILNVTTAQQKQAEIVKHLGTDRVIKQTYNGNEMVVNGPVESEEPGFTSFRHSRK